jgi:hypothetical protein
MKRLALAAVVLTLAACSSQEETPVVDSTAAPAAAPAPTMAPDSSAMMDSTAMDSTHTDSTADTTAH